MENGLPCWLKGIQRSQTKVCATLARSREGPLLLIGSIGRNRNITPAQTQLSQFVLQRLSVHSQNLGGARYVSLSVFEATSDVTALKLAPVFAKVGCERNLKPAGFRSAGFTLRARCQTGCDLFRQITRTHLFAFSHDYCALNRVLQLTDVSRPVVFHQPAEGWLGQGTLRQLITF